MKVFPPFYIMSECSNYPFLMGVFHNKIYDLLCDAVVIAMLRATHNRW